MARKKGSKAIWIDSTVHSAMLKKLADEGWTWGLTKKVESVLKDYAQGKFIPADTPKRLEGEPYRVTGIGHVRLGRSGAKDRPDQAQAG